MYQQPMGMGYGMGYGQPSYYNPGSPIDKAPVLCNCCNCTHHGCAKFWVIYNSIQVVLCYIILITEAVLGIVAMKNGSTTEKSTFYIGSEGMSLEELKNCVQKTKEDTIKNTKLSLLIVLLIIYTFGSVLFSVAVLKKNMDVRNRALFLMIYTASIACFPLAYLIPFLIDLSLCKVVALIVLFVFWWWYLSVIISTLLAFNIAIVYRRWIMKPNLAVMPESRQQIVAQQSIGSVHGNSGKDQDSDSDSDN